jgi:UDP-3-O-[3-hydroxymyristoyl] N-acetylglucosamine deacetylase
MATTISPGGDPGAPKVQTIEHLLSACAGLGLDNLYVDITPRRCPSSTAARPASCSCCRARASSCRTAPKRFLRVKKAVEVREGEGKGLKWARLEPLTATS